MSVNVIGPVPVETVVSPARVVIPIALKALSVVVYLPMSKVSSPYCWEPLVVTDCRLVVPPTFVVRLVNAVPTPPPTAALKSVSPVELAVSEWPPLTAAVNVMSPAPVATVVAPASVVVPAMPKLASVVV